MTTPRLSPALPRWGLIGLALALALLGFGCAAPPPSVDPRAVAAAAPEREPDAIARLMRISSTIQRASFTRGNRIILLQDGEQTYPAMLAAIAAAERRIDMETYQFDTEAAPIFAAALIDKAQQGVAVHLIYDSWGSLAQDRALFARLRDAGVQVVEFNPVGRSPDLDHRDHRKLLVVDGRLTITGGLNITGAYLNRVNRSETDPAQMRWRDTDIAIEGPVSAQFEALFAQTWQAQRGPPLPPPPPAPLAGPGNALVEAIDGAPVDGHPVIYETLLSAIALAKRSIHMTTGFFGPPEPVLAALRDAARRGVDVRLIVAAHSDSPAAIKAGRSHYHELLPAGVRLYELDGMVLHAKTSVIDGLWSMVGSSNLDWRSAVLNNEIDAVVVDPAFGREMEAMFAADLAHCREITPAAWARRGLLERAGETWARLFEREL